MVIESIVIMENTMWVKNGQSVSKITKVFSLHLESVAKNGLNAAKHN